MPSKRCTSCHLVLPVSDFNLRRSAADGRQARCRACAREWYVANKAEHVLRVRARNARVRAENQQHLGAYLLEHPCVDCGESDVRVLDFDHEAGHVKKNDIAALVAGCGRWSDIEAEIEKCSVRCANCHRRATSERAQDWRSGLAAAVHRDAADRSLQRLSAILG